MQIETDIAKEEFDNAQSKHETKSDSLRSEIVLNKKRLALMKNRLARISSEISDIKKYNVKTSEHQIYPSIINTCTRIDIGTITDIIKLRDQVFNFSAQCKSV